MAKRASLSGSLSDLKAQKPGAQVAEEVAEPSPPRRGRPPSPAKREVVGLTLRLDRQTYAALKRLTLDEKDRRGDYGLTTHDLMLEAIDLLLVKRGLTASAVAGKAAMTDS